MYTFFHRRTKTLLERNPSNYRLFTTRCNKKVIVFRYYYKRRQSAYNKPSSSHASSVNSPTSSTKDMKNKDDEETGNLVLSRITKCKSGKQKHSRKLRLSFCFQICEKFFSRKMSEIGTAGDMVFLQFVHFDFSLSCYVRSSLKRSCRFT